MAASLHVTWELAKKGKPFVDAELVKVCVLEIMQELLAGAKNKDDIINHMNKFNYRNQKQHRGYTL